MTSFTPSAPHHWCQLSGLCTISRRAHSSMHAERSFMAGHEVPWWQWWPGPGPGGSQLDSTGTHAPLCAYQPSPLSAGCLLLLLCQIHHSRVQKPGAPLLVWLVLGVGQQQRYLYTKGCKLNNTWLCWVDRSSWPHAKRPTCNMLFYLIFLMRQTYLSATSFPHRQPDSPDYIYHYPPLSNELLTQDFFQTTLHSIAWKGDTDITRDKFPLWNSDIQVSLKFLLSLLLSWWLCRLWLKQ